jgi:hypothetical protein
MYKIITKHYPDQNQLRRHAKQAGRAIIDLAQLGVEIVCITFSNPHPVIEVKHCPGTDKISCHLKGQGDGQGGKYIRKVALIQGCRVQWDEARP